MTRSRFVDWRSLRRRLVAPGFAVMFALASLQAQSVSDQFKQRTGNALPDTFDSAVFSLPPGVSLDKALLARDAVGIALWNNAALQADLARLDVAKADLVEAGQFRNPNFSLLLPVGPKPFEFLLLWPVEELLSRKHRVKAAKIDVQSVTNGLVQNGLNLVRDTSSAHADLWAAESRARTLAESARLAGRIAELARSRRDIGEGTGLEVALALGDSRSAEELASNVRAEVEVAERRLRWFMGMRGDPRAFSVSLGPIDSVTLPPASSLMEAALSSRPDLRAAELNVTASAERGKLERSRIVGLIAPVLNTKGIGGAGIRTGPGLTMDIPVLSQNGGRISRAEADALRAIRDYMALRDRVEMEVVQSRDRVLQAQNSLKTFREVVRPPTEESVRIAERAYKNGDVPLLNVLEASRRLTAIDIAEIDARAALARALAELERAIGRTL